MNWTIAFAPYLPPATLILFAAIGLLVLALSWWTGGKGLALRAITLGLILLALANPAVRDEKRSPLSDIALIVADRSPSQDIGDRNAQTDKALSELAAQIDARDNIEAVIVDGASQSALEKDGTFLFGEVERALARVPVDRLGAVFLLTDGQIHDAPADIASLGIDVPVHTVLSGTRNEKDRKLTIVKAPSFAIVGQPTEIEFRVDDLGVPADKQTAATVEIYLDGKLIKRELVASGELRRTELELAHSGNNTVELQVEPIEGELTTLNNRTVLIANGIRDRLRVLLVSGEPHPGERTWRNLLKSDPSVDLVHFTILRPPEKQDGTPINELALIAFPIRELFDLKLREFDLVIFDRYRRRGVLPLIYFGNIADYVEEGGALLAAAGPAFASAFSIYRTPLAGIFPGQPTGKVAERGYRARITQSGNRHPVTASLPMSSGSDEEPDWGRWFRLIETAAISGETLMDDPEGNPVMILDRVGEGRVAQLLTDQSWLWARGFEGGGPQAELLRRLAHWLMKEPDLEEEQLSARVEDGFLKVERRTMGGTVDPTIITTPSGETLELTLTEDIAGEWGGSLSVEELGLYRITSGELTTVAAAGPVNPREHAEIRTTDAEIADIADASGGGIFWAAETGTPGLRHVREGRVAAGREWAGIRRNERYTVEAVQQVPLMPPALALLLLLGTLVLAWRKESD